MCNSLPKIKWQQSTDHINDNVTKTLNINVTDVGNAGLWRKGNSSAASPLRLQDNLKNAALICYLAASCLHEEDWVYTQ